MAAALDYMFLGLSLFFSPSPFLPTYSFPLPHHVLAAPCPSTSMLREFASRDTLLFLLLNTRVLTCATSRAAGLSLFVSRLSSYGPIARHAIRDWQYKQKTGNKEMLPCKCPGRPR